MARSYTTEQAATIQDGWYAVQRMVESNSKMERRLNQCYVDQRRHFSAIASRSHVLHSVRRGMNFAQNPDKVFDDLAEVMLRAGDDDEHVLAMSVGMYYSGHDNADTVRTALEAVARAETEAQEAYLKTI